MRDRIDRRRFLKAAGSTLAAGAALAGLPSPAGAQLSSISYDAAAIPDNFGRREIIQGAMNLVASYFRDQRVVQNVYTYLRGGYNLHGDTLRNANVADNERNRLQLLGYQINALRNVRQNGRPWFPRVV